MVRALLDGRKTQTRRVIKPQPDFDDPNKQNLSDYLFKGALAATGGSDWPDKCPYGAPGDRLWVRETFAYDVAEYPDGKTAEAAIYRATTDCEDYFKGHWCPSIFMPRRLSRITLEVTKVRVQRMQEISEVDAIAEGCQLIEGNPKRRDGLDYSSEFYSLWDSINAKRGYGWDKNPWVWVVTFKRV